jgi:4-diphosphocytidyl-2-C-methyl-D-erythritol kinase
VLTFPNCKINLGLHVTSKRPDGFHDIETVFYPVSWCDALEVIIENGPDKFRFSQTGLRIEGSYKENLIYKAWELISAGKDLPNLKVHLHKNIPMGAGLGGGSSDCATFINQLNKQFSLGFNMQEKLALASRLGSDCAFFIHNTPLYARGRGDEFGPVRIDLSKYYILVVYPHCHSNTRDAYQGLQPGPPAGELRGIIENEPVNAWRDLLVNDFEKDIFKKLPAIKVLKEQLYGNGAVYASLSGSGSAVYGLFSHQPDIAFPASYSTFLQKPASLIL